MGLKESHSDESDELVQAANGATNSSILIESPPPAPFDEIRRSRSLSTNLIRRKSDAISVKEQEDIAQELCAQIDQLEAQNSAAGYSDLMMDNLECNLAATETETENEYGTTPMAKTRGSK